ncbi:hypothetical protein ACLOJK_039839 [Asimina triloba]
MERRDYQTTTTKIPSSRGGWSGNSNTAAAAAAAGGGSGGGGSKVVRLWPERKTIEKNRRILMKNLCSHLASMLPPSYNPKVEMSIYDQVSFATDYIKSLRAKVEVLKGRKESAAAAGKGSSNNNNIGDYGQSLPVVEVRDLGCAMEIVVIIAATSSHDTNEIKTSDICSILDKGGIDVLNVTFSCMADKRIYTFYSKAKISRLGFDSENVLQKLKELVH